MMVAVAAQTVFVKVNGRADYTSSVDLKKLINELWERGYSHFVFDLCQCQIMDSTFLGMLCGVALSFSNGNNPPDSERYLELVNPNARLREVLENLGVAHLFKIIDGAQPLTGRYEPLAKAQDCTRMELARTCLEAHRTLMAVKPENAAKFKDVAQFLAEDLKRLEVSDSAG